MEYIDNYLKVQWNLNYPHYNSAIEDPHQELEAILNQTKYYERINQINLKRRRLRAKSQMKLKVSATLLDNQASLSRHYNK